MLGKKRYLVRVVEAAYQIDLDRSQWLDGLVEVFSTMHGAENGLMVYLYDAGRPDEGVDIDSYALACLDDDFARATILHNAHSPPQDIRRVYHSGVRCATISEVLAHQKVLPRDHASFGRFRKMTGIEDGWGLSASNPDAHGVGIAAPLTEVSQMSEAMRELWGLVGVHLATAYRLRRSRARSIDEENAAILEPDGSLIHADGIAFEGSSPETLGHAVRQIDRARSKSLRGDPVEALPMWKGLVEGRWSLVDRIDTDGRRFVVAHPNAPRIDSPEALTQRERQVVAYACQGDSNARISYSLGLDEQAVEALLTSAMEKLGVESREALGQLKG
jgi:DNA-binding CsgD family transcriptional regulator